MTAIHVSDQTDQSSRSEHILVGRLCGLFGTRGWLKVFSYTRPRENIFSYSPWLIRAGDAWQNYELRSHRKQGSALLVNLIGVEDRGLAAGLIGRDIAILREQLPTTEAGEYYWADLLGMKVCDLDGGELGRVTRLYETGDHDVLLVSGERDHLIPFVRGVHVIDVDLARRRITVDWYPED